MTVKIRDHYDWVVLGDHPGALLSGVMVAKLGLSVLILKLAPGLKSFVSKNGQFLDPESNHWIALGKSGKHNGLVHECLTRAGMTVPESEWIIGDESLPQIVTPAARVRIAGDDESLAWEMRRELGPELHGLVAALSSGQGALTSYWAQFPQRLTLQPGKAKKLPAPTRLGAVLSQLAKSPEMRERERRQWLGDMSLSALEDRAGQDFTEILRGGWQAFTSTTPRDPALWEILHFLAIGRSSAGFKGGMTAFREYLLRVARRLGAETPTDTECRKIFVENGRFGGIQAGNSGNMITTDGGVLGCGVGEVKDVISSGGQGWFRRLKSPPTPVGWKFTVAFTVSADAIPPGMGRRVVWQESGAPVLEIETLAPGELRDLNPASRVILARTMLPWTQESLSTAFQRMVAVRMFRQILSILPFLEYHVETIYPDFRSEGGAEELSQVYGFAMPELIPENLRCYASGARGIGSRTGIDGLFCASGEAFPEYGTLGSALAGVEATAWIAHRCGLAGPWG